MARLSWCLRKSERNCSQLEGAILRDGRKRERGIAIFLYNDPKVEKFYQEIKEKPPRRAVGEWLEPSLKKKKPLGNDLKVPAQYQKSSHPNERKQRYPGKSPDVFKEKCHRETAFPTPAFANQQYAASSLIL